LKSKGRKGFFLKKEAKTFAYWRRALSSLPPKMNKSFLVRFFKKEHFLFLTQPPDTNVPFQTGDAPLSHYRQCQRSKPAQKPRPVSSLSPRNSGTAFAVLRVAGVGE
jgi:hypothetical protein